MNEQNTTNSESGKVVSLFEAKKVSQETAQPRKAVATEKPSTESSFEETIRRNNENLERLQKERLKANSSVLKSYRIKN